MADTPVQKQRLSRAEASRLAEQERDRLANALRQCGIALPSPAVDAAAYCCSNPDVLVLPEASHLPASGASPKIISPRNRSF